jgi:hypothetical protein
MIKNTRTRDRSPKAAISPIEEFAVIFHTENTLCNTAKRKATVARKALLAAMNAEDIRSAMVPTTIDGKMVTLALEIKAPTVQQIDMKLLKTLVTPKQFAQLITTTKTLVDAVAGTAVSARVIERVEVDDAAKEAVSVKVAK